MTQLGYPTSLPQMKSRLTVILADDDYHTALAEVAERVVGMVGVRRGAFYEQDGGYGQFVALVVEDDQRGRGIGSLLVEEAERWLAAQVSRPMS
jgi:GNAT superfamily N-acetyltransferase